MKQAVRLVSFFVIKVLLAALILFGLYHFGTYAFDFGRQIYSEEGVTAAPGKDVAVVISEGQSIKGIAHMLEKSRLVQNAYVFIVQERLSKYHGQIKPGSYVLNTSQSGNDMIAILSGHADEIDRDKET